MMNELKAFRIIQSDTDGFGAPSYKCDTGGNWIEEWSDTREVYDKFAVDKMIVELNRKIKLYEDLGSCKEGCPALRHNQRRVQSEIYKVKLKEKELRHQKYKRCLTMARYCGASMAYFGEFYDDASKRMVDHYYKWRDRWYRIAMQFNEDV